MYSTTDMTFTFDALDHRHDIYIWCTRPPTWLLWNFTLWVTQWMSNKKQELQDYLSRAPRFPSLTLLGPCCSSVLFSVLCFFFCLSFYVLCSMLPVSLNYLFLIAHSVFHKRSLYIPCCKLFWSISVLSSFTVINPILFSVSAWRKGVDPFGWVSSILSNFCTLSLDVTSFPILSASSTVMIVCCIRCGMTLLTWTLSLRYFSFLLILCFSPGFIFKAIFPVM